MKQILFLLLPFTAFLSVAEEIKQGQLLHAEQLVNQLNYKVLLQDIAKFENQLAKLNSFPAEVIAKSRLLKLLSVEKATEDQRAWVASQAKSTEQLSLVNPDHPGQYFEIISIARSAKNTQFQWLVNQTEENYSNQWLAHNWQWSQFVINATELEYKALSQAIKTADEPTIHWLQQQLIEQTLSQVSNRLLALLLSRKSNLTLLKQLWKNASDQYSYQVLQRLKNALPAEQAVAHIILAAENNNLMSQSLMQLAKYFQHDEIAQQFLLKKLQQPNSAWLAATALSQTSNAQLHHDLLKLVKHSNDGPIRFATKHISTTEIKE